MAEDNTDPKEPVIEPEEPIVPTPDEVEPKEDEQEEDLEEEVIEEEEERPPSRREELRIQQLLAKMKETPAEKPKNPEALDYGEVLDADPELIKQLAADRDKATQGAFNQGIEQAKSIQFHTRLEIDAPRIEAKYPQLDKESENFHPVLANAVNTMFLSAVGYDAETDTVQNPNIRYAQYVESVFELANEIAGEKNQATVKNVTRQAAQTGIRPDGASTKMNLNKDPSQMSDEELDAVIAQAVPKR